MSFLCLIFLLLTASVALASKLSNNPNQEKRMCKILFDDDGAGIYGQRYNFTDTITLTYTPNTIKNETTTILTVEYSTDTFPVKFVKYVLPADRGPIQLTVYCSEEKQSNIFNIAIIKSIQENHSVETIECMVKPNTIEQIKESVQNVDTVTIVEWADGIADQKKTGVNLLAK